jgi:sulfite reductase alpha subunit-like flavoprotein
MSRFLYIPFFFEPVHNLSSTQLFRFWTEGDSSSSKSVLQVPNFKLPLDSRRPVVMIAAGTGFAPLRGFLLQRSVLANLPGGVGPCALVYGCRSEEEDLSR